MEGGISMALNNEIRKLINDMAQEVRNIYSITVPITDINQVVRTMGGNVIDFHRILETCQNLSI